MARRFPAVLPSGVWALVVVGVLLAGLALPGVGLPGASSPAPIPKVAPAGSSGNGTLQCDGMYWSPNVSAWYEPPYCYGHDEPTVSYLSNAPGSGRNASFQVTLPSSNGVFSQGDFYATIWFGGTIYDPYSLDQQAFLEFQFYPAPPAYTGANSGSQDCLANGAFNEAWTSGTNDWFACAVVWEIFGGAEQDAANPAPLDVYGSTDAILVMHSGDHLFVNYTGVDQTQPWRLNVLDTTSGENGTLALQNSTRHQGLGPYYATAKLGNLLDWGASGPGAIAFAYEIGHALNPAIPESNPDGGCTPGDHACDSYWPGRWGQMGPMELGLPVLGSGTTAGFPLKMYYSSSQEGEREVNASTSPVGSTCPAPSFSTSENCLYPWYQYRAGNYSLTFGATDVSNSTYDYGNEYEFPGSSGPNGLALPHVVKAPWAWLNVTVAPADAQVEVNPLSAVNPLPSSPTGVYPGQYPEGDYWVNASAPGCQSLSRALYLKTMVNETVGLALTCPGSPTVPVSFLETGFPSGTPWSLDLSGLSGSASGKNITFNVSAGAYTAQPEDPVPGATGVRYLPNPSETLVEVGTSALRETVDYATQVELTTGETPSSGGTVSPSGSSWFDSGSPVSVTASPASGYAFASWTCAPSSACSSPTANPVTVTLNAPTTVTANFASLVPVSFLESGLPSGTSWQATFNGVAGTASGRNITFNVTSGTYSYSVKSPIAGASQTRYVASPSSGTVTVGNAAQTVSVAYQTQYQLTTGVSPPGSGSLSVPSGEWFGSGSTVPITATPASGYAFQAWSCTPVSACSTTSGNPVTVTMSSPTTVTADFSGPVPVSFLATGLPAGTSWQATFNGVAGTASGRNITFNVTAGSYSYTLESPVPGPTGTQFVTRPTSGTVDVGSSALSEALSYQTQYQLTVSARPSSGGSVSPSGNLWEDAGQPVTLTATAAAGYSFTGWSCTPSALCPAPASNPLTISLSGPGSATAGFSSSTVPISFLETGLPSGTAWSVVFGGVTGNAQGRNITFNVSAGTYPWSVPGPLSGAPGVRYDPSVSSGTLSVGSQAVSVPVPFTTEYRLLVTSVPPSEGSATPSSGWYASGTSVTLQAYPAVGYRFTGWASPNATGYLGPNNPQTLVLSAPLEEEARFAPDLTYVITFQETGIPAGTSWSVTLSGNTRSSSTYTLSFPVANGTFPYLLKEEVHPTPPGLRYQAEDPFGNVTVTGQSETVPVTYEAEDYLTLQAGGPGNGTVSPGSGWYAVGASLALQARPANGSVFEGWSGNGTGSYSGPANPVNLTVAQPANETAAFGVAPPLVGYVTGTVNPPNAKVTLGGQPVTVLVNGTFRVSLRPGHYLLNATLPGYAPYQTEVSVLAGKSVTVSVSLTPSSTSSSPSLAGPPGLEALYLILPPLVILALVLLVWHRKRKGVPERGAGPDPSGPD